MLFKRLSLFTTRVVRGLVTSQFLQASSIIFVVNLLVAAVNYSVPILVRNLTDKDFFPSWIALNSTVAITLVVYTALQTEFTKRVSFNHTHYGIQSAQDYLEFMKSGLTKIFWLSIPFWPGLVWLINLASPVNNWWLAVVVLANLFFQGYAVLHSSYLLGLLRVWDFCLGLILATLARPVATTIMLLLGWQLYALPLGYVVFALILLGHSIWVIRRLPRDLLSQEYQSDYAPATTNFRLTTEFWGLARTVLCFFTLSAMFNLVAIVGERVLASQDRYLLAVLFTFGQIIHYGAIAFLGAFVAYSAKSKSLKIYLTSVTAVALITLGIAGGFWLFGPWLLALMKSLEYISQMHMILYFALFVGLYNIIYVSTQYLISRNDYFLFGWLVVAVGLQILLLTNSHWIGLTGLNLFQFISINLAIAALVMLALVVRVLFLKENQKLSPV
jgi:hypothetical protein